MSETRREFLERVTGGAAALGALPLAAPFDAAEFERAAHTQAQQTWDVSWAKRVTGKHRAVFDVPEIESGFGVWRASVWMSQYRAALGTAEKDLRTVLILRHNAIVLAMSQAHWDEYGLGQELKVTHPLTSAVTDKNPALLGERDGVPAPFSEFALDRFMARGNIVLACDLAFADCVRRVKARHNLSDADARIRAVVGLVPGVSLQPSGVFAAVRAQEAGAVYVRAS